MALSRRMLRAHRVTPQIGWHRKFHNDAMEWGLRGALGHAPLTSIDGLIGLGSWPKRIRPRRIFLLHEDYSAAYKFSSFSQSRRLGDRL